MKAYDLAKIEATARRIGHDYAESKRAHADEHAEACALLCRVAEIAAPILPAIGDRVDLGPLVVARGLRVHGDIVLTSTGLLSYAGARIGHPNLTELSVPEVLAGVRTIVDAIDAAGSRRGAANAARTRAAKLRALVTLLAS